MAKSKAVLVKQELKDGQMEIVKEYAPAVDYVMVAMEKNLPMETLERMIKMRNEELARIAKDNFTTAFAEFQRNCPILKKTQDVKFKTKDDKETSYKSSDLAVLDEQTKEHLASAGLTKDWEYEQQDGKIIVTCVITGPGGHEKRVPLWANADTSGGKNAIQALGSTLTYLRRYTFEAALGLTTIGQDDDGRAHIDQSAAEFNEDALPSLNSAHLSEAIKKINSKEWTVEFIQSKYTLTDSQLRTLTIAEKNVKSEAI